MKTGSVTRVSSRHQYPFHFVYHTSFPRRKKERKTKTRQNHKPNYSPPYEKREGKKKKKTIQPETKSELHKSRTPNYEEFALEADTEDEKYKASECRDFCCSQKAVRNPSKWLYISQTFLQGKKKKKSRKINLSGFLSFHSDLVSLPDTF